MHASRTVRKDSGERLSNTQVTYPQAGNSLSKDRVIPHVMMGIDARHENRKVPGEGPTSD